MLFRLARPMVRSTSRYPQFRQRIPQDLLSLAKGRKFVFTLPVAGGEEHGPIITATAGEAIAFSLRTADRGLAARRHGAALEQFQAHMEALRGGGLTLAPRTRAALAGLIYREFTGALKEDPVLSAEQWRSVAQTVRDEARAGGPLSIPTEQGVQEALEARLGKWVDFFLNREGLNVTPDSRAALLKDVARAMAEASERLAQESEGDYRPDRTLERFPPYEAPKKRVASKEQITTFSALLSFWQNENKPARSTIVKWQACVKRFETFLRHSDPARVTEDDVRRWRDALLAEGIDPSATYLAALSAIYNAAMEQKARTGIMANPAAAVRLSKGQRRAAKANRVKRQPYSDKQVAAILAAAERETDAAKKWVPWILACTGVRVSEAAQLWGKNIFEREGVWLMEFTHAEDDPHGRLKTEDAYHRVPVHPALIEQGFLDFVKQRGEGPLFYRTVRRKLPHTRKDGMGTHVSGNVANKVRKWVKATGLPFDDQGPNHSFRHWLKTAFLAKGVPETIADAISGHASGKRSAADGYRHVTIDMMREAMAKVPLPSDQ